MFLINFKIILSKTNFQHLPYILLIVTRFQKKVYIYSIHKIHSSCNLINYDLVFVEICRLCDFDSK